MIRISLAAVICLALFSCQNKQKVDAIYTNANIVTVNDSQPKAASLAVKDGKIVAVSEANLQSKFEGEVFDLGGKTLIPGFIEGHGHFMGMGRSLKNLNFLKVKNFEEMLEMTREAVKTAKEGEWIVGRGWHQEKWDNAPENAVDGLPRNTMLSKIAPNNPVVYRHASGHSLIANEAAMKLAGVTEKWKAPFGGENIRDKNGKLIGVFLENSMRIFQTTYDAYLAKRSAEQVAADEEAAANRAMAHAIEHGVTSFHDAGALFEELDLYKKLAEANALDVRIWAMIQARQDGFDEKFASYKTKTANNQLTIGGIKLSMDGALGSHGAWMLEPYSDLPSTSGLNLVPEDRFKQIAEGAYANNLQMCTHAIGDKTNRVVLNVYENFLKEGDDRRWRVEHAQHLNPADIPRFAALGVTAAMQGVHCTSDGPWVPKRIGEKRSREGAYMWKTLMESGALVTNGTDVPVEAISPIESYYSTISRMMKSGERFFENERLSRLNALKTYTINNAKAVFEEDLKGSIEVGKLADFIVLDQDILTVDEEKIPQTRVLLTVVGGKRYAFE